MPAVMILVLALVCLLRVGGTGATDTIWAEDGSLFFQDSLHAGPLRLLLTPYNGYLHLVPRLAIDVARLFPIADLAAVLAVTGALISGGVAVFVFDASRACLRSPALQAVAAAPAAAGWVAQAEVGNNVCDAQWLLLYAAFWAALSQASDLRSRVSGTAVLFLAAASDPFAGLYLPLLRRRRIPALGLAAGTAFQAVGVLFMGAWGSRDAHRDYSVPYAAYAYLAKVVGHALWPVSGLWQVGVALCVAVSATAFRRLPLRRFAVSGTALAYSILIYAALVTVGGFVAPRYAYLAGALLLAAIAAAVAETGRGEIVLVAAVAICVCCGYFAGQSARATGPSWRAQIRPAAARCQAADHRAAQAELAISPPGWTVRIPCRLLTPYGR